MRAPSWPPLTVVLLAVLVPAAAMLPTWHGYHCQRPPDKVFMGFRYMSDDHYQYAAFIRQAYDGGGLLMRNPFASEPQAGVFVLPLFWTIGALSRALGGSVVAWWEIFRVVGGALYVLAFWGLTALHLRTPRERTLATGLFCLGGGLDWIVLVLQTIGVPGLDGLAQPFRFQWNWSTFGTMLLPNWVWPALLLTVAVRVAGSSSGWRAPLLVGLLPVVWFVHPYTAMVGYLTFALLPVVPLVIAALGLAPLPWGRARAHLRVALPAVLSFLLVGPYLWWARHDPVFRVCSERGLTWTDSYSIWWYPLCYGLILPLAWFGARALAKQASLHAELLLAWLAAAVILALNPLYAGVKFQYLVFPPLALLATRGLLDLHAQLLWLRRVVAARAGLIALAAVLCLNSLVQILKDFPATEGDDGIFMSFSELAAMQWLDGQPAGVVLSSVRAGERLPWLAGKPVFLGHWFLTTHRPDKLRYASAFFSSRFPAAVRADILAASGARYVYVGPDEARNGFDPTGLPLLRVYQSQHHTVYEVRPVKPTP